MSTNRRPDYKVFVTTKSGDKTYYHEVGAAWAVGNNGISIKLNALPVTGELVLFPPRENEGGS